jgi:hypothetical protein
MKIVIGNLIRESVMQYSVRINDTVLIGPKIELFTPEFNREMARMIDPASGPVRRAVACIRIIEMTGGGIVCVNF